MLGRRLSLLGTLLLLGGCQAIAALREQPAPAPIEAADAAKPVEPAAKAPEPETPRKHADPNRTFTLPFVREPGAEDPGDRARGFLREVLRDNASFMRGHDASYFKPFAETQRPRATLVTCSDSRVQSPSFDATPDNDVFTIRDIGNQLETAAGSVAYGIEHLKTPLLIVLGHSGCGAVKAAMADFSKQPEPIRRELATLDLTPISAKGSGEPGALHAPEKRAAGTRGEAMSWIEAVVVNVNHQVAHALVEFSDPVATHDLIVVGAVYDFRNEMRRGIGAVTIVNVNGYTDAAKIAAFVKALDDRPGGSSGGPATAVTPGIVPLPFASSSLFSGSSARIAPAEKNSEKVEKVEKAAEKPEKAAEKVEKAAKAE